MEYSVKTGLSTLGGLDVPWRLGGDRGGDWYGHWYAVANGWVDVDLTGAVTGNGTYSFVATSSSTNTAVFSSREGSSPPQVIVTRRSLGSFTYRPGK